MSRRNARRTAATAHHEAGHAVAYYWLREIGRYPLPRMRRVTIVPQEKSLGHVAPFPTSSFRPDYDHGPRVQLRVQGQIMVSLAGRIAERRHTGRRVRGGWGKDYEQAVDLASRVTGGPEETSAMLRWLALATESLLAQRWSLVEAVAQALLAQPTLTGREVVAVIRSELDAQVRQSRKHLPSP
jgi:ATP-dependent Zn protease